jgi:tripartite-type tricarboxylate transporter receptor subunit TctC
MSRSRDTGASGQVPLKQQERHIDVAGLNLGEIGMLGQDRPALRPLAAMGPRRWDLMPDVPTFIELGYDVLMTSERGIGAPRDVPDEIALRLQDGVARVVAKPEWCGQT